MGQHMFSGSHSASIDEKGRLAMPARFRAALAADAGGQLAITPTPDGIKLYPMPVFERIAKEVIPKHPDIAQRRALKNLFVGQAMTVEMDAQGRLLVPAKFREALTASVMLVGQVDHFALWSEAAWIAHTAAGEADYAAAFAALDL
jgi:MraZ protein